MTMPNNDGIFCNLPLELIDHILGFTIMSGIHKQVLPQFCLLSRSCCALAQPLLFHSVDPTREVDEKLPLRAVEKRVLLTLTLFKGALYSRPSLRKHVAKLVIPADVLVVFNGILRTLISLRSLNLLGFFSWYDFGQEEKSTLLDYVFPRLHYLKLKKMLQLPFLTLLNSFTNLRTLHLETISVGADTMITDGATCPQHLRSLQLSNLSPSAFQNFESGESLSDALTIFRVKALKLLAGDSSRRPAVFLSSWLPRFGSQLSELQLDWDFCSDIIQDWAETNRQDISTSSSSVDVVTIDLSNCPELEILRIHLPRYKSTQWWQPEAIVASLFLNIAKIFGYGGKECICPSLKEFVVLPSPIVLGRTNFGSKIVTEAYSALDEVLTDRQLLPEMRRFEVVSLSNIIRKKNLMPRCLELGLLLPIG